MSQDDNTTQSAKDEAFIRAVNGKNYSAMQDALDGGANINVQNVRGITPLHAAVMARNMALVDWLAKRGANPCLKNLAGDSALHDAAKIEDVDFLGALLGAKGVDVNVANSLGSTPLMEAASAGRLQNVKALMKHKADPGLKSTQGASALLIAAGRQQHEMVSVLLAHGANPNDSNSYGVSALISAAGGGGEEAAHEASAKTMKVLIAAGADIDMKARSGNSPLAEAAQYQNRRGMMVLLNLGADPNVHTTAGVNGELTPLMIAAYKHDLELVELLIER
jgi:ankyrin repeat protein